MAAHMGMFEVKGHVLRVHGQFLRPLVRIQVWARFNDPMACCTRSSSHTVAACCGCTNIPRTAGGAQEAGTILSVGCGGQRPSRFGHLDPAGLISLCGWGQILPDAAFIMAPSMTTPAVVYRHRAIRSLRARATMIVLRIRPLRRRTRSWNHRLSVEVGWFRSHSQANSTMVVLSRGLPALDTPCS